MRLVVGMFFLAIASLSCVNRTYHGNFDQAKVDDSLSHKDNKCALRSMARTIAGTLAKKGFCGALGLYFSTAGLLIADAREPVHQVKDDFVLDRPCVVADSDEGERLPLDELKGLMAPVIESQIGNEKVPMACEIPSGAIFPKPSMSYVRARAVRDTMLLVMAAARQVSDKSLSIPADYLFHYLAGSGAPKVIKEPKLVESLHRAVLRGWEREGRPKKAKIEITYSDYAYDMNAPISNAIGRARVEVTADEKEGKLDIRVNDGYVWPGYKYRGLEENGIYHPFIGVPPLLGKYLVFLAGPTPKEFAIPLVREDSVSDGLWHELQRAGAKEYLMLYKGSVAIP